MTQSQLAAAVANAQKSTGPKTEEGKRKSALNAMKHALTGQVVLLPTDDMAAYNAHVDKITKELEAVAYQEQVLAKAIADCFWRLERLVNLENGTFAIGHMDEHRIGTGHERINDTISNAQVVHNENKTFHLYSVYEQRLTRTRKQNEARLKELVEARKAKEAKDLQEAKLLAKMAYMNNQDYDPQPDGFVFSRQQIRSVVERELRLEEARYYQKAGWSRRADPPKIYPRIPRAA